MRRLLITASIAALFAYPSVAQTYQDSGGTIVPGIVPIAPGVGPLFTSSNPGKISGSFSANLTGFQPTPAYAAPLSVGSTSSRVALPSGTVVVVYNTGANPAFVTLGNSTVSATTSDDVIQPNSWMAFTVGASTYLAAIETLGVTTLNLSGGSGLPTGSGGGGGSGGSSVPTGSAGAPNASVVSVQGVSGATVLPVSSSLTTTNGWTPLRLSALSTTVQAIKGSAGQLGMLHCYNPNSTQIYAQVFNAASGSVTLGSTSPALSIAIAPTSTGGWALPSPGAQFSTAMSIAATTTATGSTAPSTAADCNVVYN